MDRYKTRYYDNDMEEYVLPEMILVDGNGMIFFKLKEEDGFPVLCCIDDQRERFTRERGTGRKDKNGKLIFEGDIIVGVGCGNIDAPLYPKKSLPHLQVEYEHNCWYCSPCNMEKCFQYDKRHKTELLAGLMLNHFMDIEVIGNIHEAQDEKD